MVMLVRSMSSFEETTKEKKQTQMIVPIIDGWPTLSHDHMRILYVPHLTMFQYGCRVQFEEMPPPHDVWTAFCYDEQRNDEIEEAALLQLQDAITIRYFLFKLGYPEWHSCNDKKIMLEKAKQYEAILNASLGVSANDE